MPLEEADHRDALRQGGRAGVDAQRRRKEAERHLPLDKRQSVGLLNERKHLKDLATFQFRPIMQLGHKLMLSNS